MSTSIWSGSVRLVARRRDVLEDRLEQRLEPMILAVGREPADAIARDRVKHREVELVLLGVEVDEQVVDLVEHLAGPRVAPVDLVDHHDRRQAELQRLAQHEAGLRQRALAGVDQQQHAVHHRERALHLAAEVGVAGRVDDVDLVPAVAGSRVFLARMVMPFSRSRSLGVHDPLDHLLVLAEHAALPQHGVHQGGLAVVHVGDDRDVAQVIAHRGGGQGVRVAKALGVGGVQRQAPG